jgi:hypothetical protein
MQKGPIQPNYPVIQSPLSGTASTPDLLTNPFTVSVNSTYSDQPSLTLTYMDDGSDIPGFQATLTQSGSSGGFYFWKWSCTANWDSTRLGELDAHQSDLGATDYTATYLQWPAK